MMNDLRRFFLPFSGFQISKPLIATRLVYWLKARYHQLRITRSATSLLGSQYVRSRDHIEIDITYACNMRCLNCNRSVAQAPERIHMSVEMIDRFVRNSIDFSKRWKRIRLLGGEPTLHPEFFEILDLIRRYREWEPDCVIEISTNGKGKAVNSIIEKIPSDFKVVNSAKKENVQPSFGPFNLAPIDDPAFRHASYTNGCSVMRDCGMSLTPMGYYPCAVAGGIDRIARLSLGYTTLPADQDDMADICDQLCRYCGHFRDGHAIPDYLRPALIEAKMSDSWVTLYASWKQEQVASPLRAFNKTHC